MINGIVNVYKEEGYTSFDVVAKLRGIFGQRKIGHTGTLDPNATGVLPVCLGTGTKLVDALTDKEKVYEAQMLLGTITDTEDIWGTIIEERDYSKVEEKEILELLPRFIGDIMQVPPMYSALKVSGKRLYELAREGVVIDRKPRCVTIKSIEVLKIDIPKVAIRVTCGKGTYIRSLCRDLGEALGCGACMSELSRVRVDDFVIDNAYTLSSLQRLKDDGRLQEAVIGIDEMFKELPKEKVSGKYHKLLINGNMLPMDAFSNSYEKDKRIRVYDEDSFFGIYEFSGKDKAYVPFKIFADTSKG